MRLVNFTAKVNEDIRKLRKENSKLAAKLLLLIIEITENPYTGTGQPEALKGNLQGWWSRRIDRKHRIVYRIKDEVLEIASCYGHYDDK